MTELAALLEELRDDEAGLLALGRRALDDLRRKLPTELLEELDGPQRLRALLDQAGPLLFERLLGADGSDAARPAGPRTLSDP